MPAGGNVILQFLNTFLVFLNFPNLLFDFGLERRNNMHVDMHSYYL